MYGIILSFGRRISRRISGADPLSPVIWYRTSAIDAAPLMKACIQKQVPPRLPPSDSLSGGKVGCVSQPSRRWSSAADIKGGSCLT